MVISTEKANLGPWLLRHLPPDRCPVANRRKYRKRAGSRVVAVQLDLETEGFTYQKWGDTQTCKPRDWLVKNEDDTYTVDRDTFARTYRQVSPGVFEKVTSVWAEVAERDGVIVTKEGPAHYPAGAYLVFNDEGGSDGYFVEAEKFEKMYELE